MVPPFQKTFINNLYVYRDPIYPQAPVDRYQWDDITTEHWGFFDPSHMATEKLDFL
jgi:hypothetical protein